MKNMKNLTKMLVFLLISCFVLCLFVGCGDTENKGENVGEEKMKTYNISVTSGIEYGGVAANPVKAENGGTKYEFVFSPKQGYFVKELRVSGVQIAVEDNKASCVIGGDCNLDITYARKTNEELEKRRTKVLDEMKLITGTYFKLDKDYDYKITSKKDAKLDSTKLLQGIPYSNFPTVSYYHFIAEYTTGTPDENGIYTLKDIWADEANKAIVGNNCADTIYWSWATISSTINCVLSGSFSEPNGCVNVGKFTVEEGELNANGGYINTTDVAKRNGMFTMFDSYAMLMKGDAVMNATNGAGHIVMVGEVSVVRGTDGKIDGDRSHIIYYDQNAGYQSKTAYNGQQVMSSTENGDKWSFTKLFDEGYLPLTCKELMDESYEIPEETVTDSLKPEQHTLMNVTRGFIESNYYFSKIRMEITDANVNAVFAANRFRDELNPRRVALSWFTQTKGTEYQQMTIYKEALNTDTLAAGSYHCKVTVWLASGNSYVVRDFDFTK